MNPIETPSLALSMYNKFIVHILLPSKNYKFQRKYLFTK